MIDIKADFSGGLNLDDALMVLPKNCYIDAYNISRDAIAGSNDRAITNVFGNRPILLQSSLSLTPSVLNKYTDVGITITNQLISAGTRITSTLLKVPGNIITPVLDYTSTQNLNVDDYVAAAAASMISSIDACSAFVITDGNISPGTYTGVTQNSTTGNGFGGTFDVVVAASNVITSITAVDGGLNYAVLDNITINGSQFGGINGQDDLIITVNSISLRSGILLSGSIANQLYFRFNYNTALTINAYSWQGYTLHLGRPLTGYTCLGAYPNTIRNKIIYFLYQSGGYHMILQYDLLTEDIIKILENLVDTDNVDILNFTTDKKITSVNIYNRDEGDLLYFIDTLGRPTGLDIEKFINGEYIPVTRDIIDVCKRPPLSPISCIYANDNNFESNNLREKFFRFKYRYVYDDLSKSVCSPISILPIPINILDFGNDGYGSVITNNNVIKLNFLSGDKDVKEIELLMSYVDKTNDWSDFAIIEKIGKELTYTVKSTTNTLASPSQTSTTFSFSGVAIPGAWVRVYMYNIPTSSEQYVADYVITSSDTLQSFVYNLYQSVTIFPPGSVVLNNNSFTITYDPSVYQYTRVSIIYQLGVDNLYYNYAFYNNSAYPLIDINESIQLYDYVPELANCQELVNGNVLVYGGITEGYDKDLIANVELSVNTYAFGPGSTGLGNFNISKYQEEKLYGAVQTPLGPIGGTWRNTAYYKFSGVPPAGTTITIYVKNSINAQFKLTEYQTAALDTTSDIRDALFNNINNMSPLVPYYDKGTIGPDEFVIIFYNGNPYYQLYEDTTFPTGLYNSLSNPKKTFLNSSTRDIGIAYFDNKGKTNGILWNQNLSFPAYAEDVTGKTLLPQIDIQIFHQPPIWAYSYQFYLTRENTSFLYWVCKINTLEIDYLYLDITTLQLQQELYPTTSKVLSWTFKEGDRVRLIRNMKTNFVYSDNYDAEVIGIIKDPLINNTTVQGLFIKIPSKEPFKSTFTTGIPQNDEFEIQIYHLAIPDDKIYFEFGQQFNIINPGQINRAHDGQINSQVFSNSSNSVFPATFSFTDGDVYFRQRIYYYPGSNLITIFSPIGIPSNAPGSNNVFSNMLVYDRNIVDNYTSAVNDLMGRPNIIDQDAKRAYYSTLVRFGQAYQPNTNINGLPRFYSTNFDEYDYTFGDIMRFKVRDRFMRVFQKLKVGMVPLYQQMVKNQDSETLVVSDKLLNPVQYYQGDVGIGDNPESLASYNYADYFTSNIRGVICRASQNGVEFLSQVYKINSWANQHVGDLSPRFKMGVFDQRLGNYILAMTASANFNTETIVFDEEYNNFETFLTFYPEMMVALGTTLASFKDGIIYIHNNSPYNTFFDGQTNDSYITPVFNENPYQKKTFLAISEVGNTVWDMPNIQTDLNSYGNTKQTSNLVDSDFTQLEGTYEATILRDQNSQGGIIAGDTMKGKYLISTFRKVSPTILVTLNIVSCKYIDSPLTNR